MAKKRKQAKKSRSKRTKKKYEEEEEDEFEGLSPQTKRRIVSLILALLGVVSLLALFDSAGPVGRIWSLILTRLFGWGDFLIPVLLLWLSFITLRGSQHVKHAIHYWGLTLLVFSTYALLHATQGSEELISSIALGKGGGYAGLVFSWPMFTVFGSVAGVLILVALFIISILLLFDNAFERLFGEHNIFRQGYMQARHSMLSRKYSGEDGGYDEEYEEEGDEYEEEYEEGEEELEEEEEIEEEPKKDNESAVQETLLTPPPKRLPKIKIPVDLLSGKQGKPNSGDVVANQEIIRSTLETFGIEVTMGEVNVGPTVTQYTLRPSRGVKLTQITTLQNDIALALAAHPIRIEAPIPGKSLVGIEVPNKSVALVSLKEVLSSTEFQKKRPSLLSIPFGKDVSGKTFLGDLGTMPHLLIAGATGSGKSIAINAIILSLMYQNQPSDLKFILVDPKQVELMSYKHTPYLLTPVITDVKKTVSALRWAVAEMERRYSLLSKEGHRQISSYNDAVSAQDKLPYIVVIVDELADLMLVAAKEVESAIVRIAQMARAVGIHLIIATQRPSVDVITGLIKANIPARAAFSVASVVDSRTILDSSGAEKLLGRGDMLFINAELSKPKRLQGAFVSDQDIRAVTTFLRDKASPDYLEDVITQTGPIGVGAVGGMDASDSSDSDELLEEAKKVILEADKASASLLQRRLRVGYARAARILDILEDAGFVGPADGSKPREILFDPENNAEEGGYEGEEMLEDDQDDEDLVSMYEDGDAGEVGEEDEVADEDYEYEEGEGEEESDDESEEASEEDYEEGGMDEFEDVEEEDEYEEGDEYEEEEEERKR